MRHRARSRGSCLPPIPLPIIAQNAVIGSAIDRHRSVRLTGSFVTGLANLGGHARAQSDARTAGTRRAGSRTVTAQGRDAQGRVAQGRTRQGRGSKRTFGQVQIVGTI